MREGATGIGHLRLKDLAVQPKNKFHCWIRPLCVARTTVEVRLNTLDLFSNEVNATILPSAFLV